MTNSSSNNRLSFPADGVVNLRDPAKFLDEVKRAVVERKKESKVRLEKKERERLIKKEGEKKEKDEEEIKKEVLGSKIEIKDMPQQDLKKHDTRIQKAGHTASSVPGTKQGGG